MLELLEKYLLDSGTGKSKVVKVLALVEGSTGPEDLVHKVSVHVSPVTAQKVQSFLEANKKIEPEKKEEVKKEEAPPESIPENPPVTDPPSETPSQEQKSPQPVKNGKGGR